MVAAGVAGVTLPTLTAPVSVPARPVSRHPVLEVRGGTIGERSAELAAAVCAAEADGVKVRRINPAGREGEARSLAGAQRVLFDLLEVPASGPGVLLTVDNLGALLLDGGSAQRDAFDVTLSMLVSQAPSSTVRLVIATRPGLVRVAPATAFELRMAPKIDL